MSDLPAPPLPAEVTHAALCRLVELVDLGATDRQLESVLLGELMDEHGPGAVIDITLAAVRHLADPVSFTLAQLVEVERPDGP